MSAFFVTATGTDIGKTFVAAGLIRHLRAQGKDARAFKPVLSGFDLANATASDAGILLEAMGIEITPQLLEIMSPWRFSAPLSPDIAAAREGKTLNFDAIVAAARARIGQGTLFIEGVGGTMVPLDARHTTLDLMAALRLPVIVVAGSYLGTLSHTLTAIHALRSRDIAIAALVVNESVDAPPLAETAATLARFAHGAPVTTIRRAPDAEFAALAALLNIC